MKNAKDLTREETIKALRVCGTYGGKCEACPLYVSPPDDSPYCYNKLLAHAADILETALSVQYE